MELEEREGVTEIRLTSQKVQEIMKKNGNNVSLEHAEFILRFVQKFANVAIVQALESDAG